MINHQSEKVLSKWLLVGAALISIIVTSSSVTDPVNAPKFFVLGGVAVGIFLQLGISDLKYLWEKQTSVMVALIIFLLASINSLIQSAAPISQSLYGVYGRNNGFLLYLFLTLLFLGTLALRKVESVGWILRSFLLVGFVNLAYCLWVISFGDFIGWNNPYGNILGTFGNPNFIGAFLGMLSSVLITLVIKEIGRTKLMVTYSFLLVVCLFEIYMSHAVQGIVLFCVSVALNIFFILRAKAVSKILQVTFAAITGFVGTLSVLGTLQIGPLTDYLYKYSVTLRGQYWNAGVKMGMTHLWSGVGFDSYGDWYRTVRRPSALIHPGVDTVSNAAHNVFIDLFAFGGLPLVVAYAFTILLVGVNSIKYIRKHKQFDAVFIALFGAWLCYQIQSVVSINQIGLAIWGWILGGAILAYVRNGAELTKQEQLVSSMKRTKRPSSNQSVFSAGIRAFLGLVFGLLLSVPPLSADISWRHAELSQNLTEVEKTLKPSYMNPVSSFKYLNIIGALSDSGFSDLAHDYTVAAVRFNPHSYESWRLFTLIKGTSQEEMQIALRKMKELDPLNPGVKVAK